MSSLTISLWLLVAAAIILVIAFNLRQAWPRWRRRRAAGAGLEPLAGAGAGPTAAEATRPRRNEPRLAGDGTGTPGADPADAADEADGDPGLGDPADLDADRPPYGSSAAGAASMHERAGAAGAGGEEDPADGYVDGDVPGYAQGKASASLQGKASAPVHGAGGASLAPDAAGSAADRQPAGQGVPGATSTAAPSAAEPAPRAAGGREPLDPEAGAARDGAAAPAPRPIMPLVSELCDCVIVLKLSSNWPGERLLPVTQRFRRAGGKPVAAEARPVGAARDDWQPVQPGQHYEAVRIGILMANRSGPLNALEFSDFIAGAQALADQFGSSIDVPDMGVVLARARDLDSTCAQFDGLVGLNVECVDPLGPDQLAALAAPLALAERGNNRYARLGPHGEVVFSVALADVPNRIAFLLDVPRAAPSLEPWGQTVGCAMQCAQRIGGRLIDDNGRALNEADLTRVDRQVRQRYESLEAIGLPAGSSLALKVFN
ncbi:MAG: hypothetical protein AB7L76_15015 [Burkholderiaceae bacterium]